MRCLMESKIPLVKIRSRNNDIVKIRSRNNNVLLLRKATYQVRNSMSSQNNTVLSLRTQTEREIIESYGADRDAIELAKSIVEEIDKSAAGELGLYGKAILVAAILLEIRSDDLVAHIRQAMNQDLQEQPADDGFVEEEICYDDASSQETCEIVLRPKVIARREAILQDVLNILNKFKRRNILADEEKLGEKELQDMFKVDTKASILKDIESFYNWLKSLRLQEIEAQQIFKGIARPQRIDDFMYCLHLCQDQKIELIGKDLLLEKIKVI